MEMLSIAKQKWIRSLHHKKYREKYGYFIGEGEKLFNEIIRENSWEIELITASPDWWARNENLIPFEKCSQRYLIEDFDLKNISTLSTPQDPLIVLKTPVKNEIIYSSTQRMILYLDGIRDPGNLGTILRIADWFGHTQILVSEDTVDWTNTKVIQASMGSFLRIEILPLPLEALPTGIKENRTIYGASMEGIPISEMGPDPAIVIIGNESSGIRQECLEHIDQMIHIPGEGRAESLNAAIASAIFSYEFYKNKKE